MGRLPSEQREREGEDRGVGASEDVVTTPHGPPHHMSATRAPYHKNEIGLFGDKEPAPVAAAAGGDALEAAFAPPLTARTALAAEMFDHQG